MGNRRGRVTSEEKDSGSKQLHAAARGRGEHRQGLVPSPLKVLGLSETFSHTAPRTCSLLEGLPRGL